MGTQTILLLYPIQVKINYLKKLANKSGGKVWAIDWNMEYIPPDFQTGIWT